MRRSRGNGGALPGRSPRGVAGARPGVRRVAGGRAGPACASWSATPSSAGSRRCIEVSDREGHGERSPQALLRLEPAHEEAHRALIRHHGERGDVAAAVRQYQACREALARELDLEPLARDRGPAQRTAHGSALAGGSSGRRRPARSLARSRSQLRTTLTIEPKALVLGDLADQRPGRRRWRHELREALARVRWLTVLDPAIWLPPHGVRPRTSRGSLRRATPCNHFGAARQHAHPRSAPSSKRSRRARVHLGAALRPRDSPRTSSTWSTRSGRGSPRPWIARCTSPRPCA